MKQNKCRLLLHKQNPCICFSARMVGAWVPDLPSSGDKQRFDGERHTDPTSDHIDPNPATFAPRLLWLSSVHCPVDLATKANPCLRIKEHNQERERTTEL